MIVKWTLEAMAQDPALHFRVFVCGIVVDDRMKKFFRRLNLIDQPPEGQHPLRHRRDAAHRPQHQYPAR